jgi:hypothetical protein
MNARAWAIVAVLGFGVMLAGYMSRIQIDPRAPWAHGLLILGPEDQAKKDLPGKVVRARARLLEVSPNLRGALEGIRLAAPDAAPSLEAELRPKLISLSLTEAGIDPDWLQSGRFPAPDGQEVLAGARHARGEEIVVGDRTLKTVGVLKPDVSLLADCYLIPQSAEAGILMSAANASVSQATLLELSPAQFRNRETRRKVEEAFPTPKYSVFAPAERLDARSFYIYLAGQGVLLVAGSGALIGFYRWLAGAVRVPVLDAPLGEMLSRPRLLWGVHLVYFGLVVAGSILVYQFPEFQALFGAVIRAQLKGSTNPLGVAAKAYETGNVFRAAGVTFAINFFLGSLAVLTLPSLVIPGSGVLVAGVRAFLWGLLLAPTFEVNATAMLPHTGTMLLEGEGYILAAFFGLLVPILLLQSAKGESLFGRFGRAIVLNLKSIVLVALVLIAAAFYEAIEVIAMM